MSYVPITSAHWGTGKAGIGPTGFGQLVGDDLADHETRISSIQASNSETIITDFAVTALDSNMFTSNTGVSGTITFQMASTGEHTITIARVASVGSFAGFAAAASHMAFRLNKDMVVQFAWKQKSTITGAGPADMLYGFADVAQTIDTSVPSLQNLIGFIKGTNADTYKFRTMKAGAATDQDNLASRSAAHSFKLILTKAGATLQVDAQIDGVAIVGSPFTTNIPDGVALRPFMYVGDAVASNAESMKIDYFRAQWTTAMVDVI